MTTPQQNFVFDYGEPDQYPSGLYHYRELAEKINGFDAVTDDHLALFRAQGYLAIENAFTPDEVQAALDGLLYLVSGQNPEFKGIMLEKKAKGVPIESLPPEQRQDYVRKFMYLSTMTHD